MQETRAEIEGFSGPLPHPDTLRQYDDIKPGLADTIVQMAKEEMLHRHGMEKRVVKWNLVSQLLGQIFGFLLGALAIGGGIYLAVQDKGLEGLATLITGVASLVYVFHKSRKQTDDIESNQ